MPTVPPLPPRAQLTFPFFTEERVRLAECFADRIRRLALAGEDLGALERAVAAVERRARLEVR